MSKVSIVIPIYKEMDNWEFFLNRCLESVKQQTFKDYEIVMPETGKGWSVNHNAGIRQAKGELIKFLHQDDFFYDESSLQKIVDNFKSGWLITGCVHDSGVNRYMNPHFPAYNPEMWSGKNTIGGPSVLTIENKEPLFFDENLTWLVDCDYYERLYSRYGSPTILNDMNVVIGLHPAQATNLISADVKQKEYYYMENKYEWKYRP